jgi:HlyD family secretion protein
VPRVARSSHFFPSLVPIAVVLTLGFSGCSKPAKVKTAIATRQRVEATVAGVSSGTVRSEQIAELAFGMVGRVRALNVKLGDLVKERQILAEVENEDLRSRVAVAREELERHRRLVTNNAMSRSSLIQAQAEFDAALTTLEKSIIRAPCDGLVAELNLEVGQLSQITAVIPKALIRVVDLGPRYVRVEIDEVDLPRIRVGMTARVKVLAVRRDPFVGTVRKVVNYISDVREQDRTSEVEISIESEGVVLPVGASADVEVVTEYRENAVALISRAIVGRGSNRHVFLVENGRVRKVPVEVGIFNYQVSEVLVGLSAGSVVALPSDDVELRDGGRIEVAEASLQ